MTFCEGLLRSGDGFGVWPREGSLRVARPAGADSRRREAGVLGGHADERRQRRCPAGRQPKGTPRPGRSALLRLLERAPPCRRRRASRPIPGRWRRARDPRGARPPSEAEAAGLLTKPARRGGQSLAERWVASLRMRPEKRRRAASMASSRTKQAWAGAAPAADNIQAQVEPSKKYFARAGRGFSFAPRRQSPTGVLGWPFGAPSPPD